MIRKEIGKKIEVSPDMARQLAVEFDVSHQSVRNALTFRAFSTRAMDIRERALQLGGEVVDRYIWVDDAHAQAM